MDFPAGNFEVKVQFIYAQAFFSIQKEYNMCVYVNSNTHEQKVVFTGSKVSETVESDDTTDLTMVESLKQLRQSPKLIGFCLILFVNW